MKVLSIIFLGSLFLVGCGSGNMPVNPVDKPPQVIPLEPTFQSIMANIIGPKCMECHAEATNNNHQIALSTYEQIMDPGKNLVDPEEGFEESKLWFFIITDDLGKRMPLNRDPLTEEEIQMIEEWITEGALNN